MKKDNLHKDSDRFLAQWLEGNLSDNDLKNLVGQDDYVAFLKLREGLDMRDKLNAPLDDSFLNIKERISNKKPKVRSLYTNWAIGIAASIVVLFGLFMFTNNDEIIIETSFGESKTIALLDGSEVILNSKSKLTYDEDGWQDDRKLYLEGEAYFKVAKGETFVVNTDNGSVSVLGTEFNVNSTKEYFNVVCYEGKVGVKTETSENILMPSDAVRSINGNTLESYKNFDKIPTWIQGESTFNSVPLHIVIKALERNYNISFESKDIDKSEIFTGSFPNDSLNIALRTVFRPLNITYSEKENRNIKLRYKE